MLLTKGFLRLYNHQNWFSLQNAFNLGNSIHNDLGKSLRCLLFFFEALTGRPVVWCSFRQSNFLPLSLWWREGRAKGRTTDSFLFSSFHFLKIKERCWDSPGVLILPLSALQVFGNIKMDEQTQINKNNNFQSFAAAILLLFRWVPDDDSRQSMLLIRALFGSDYEAENFESSALKTREDADRSVDAPTELKF